MDVLRFVLLSFVLFISVSNGMASGRYKRAPYCKTRIDLAFVIDSSRSISRNDFEKQIQFVNDIVDFLDVGSDETRVAAVSFSNHLFPQFGFNDYTTKTDVLGAINGIKHSMGDATRTYLALEHTHQTLFAPGNGERPDVVDVVVVLTDGATNPGSYDRLTGSQGKQKTQNEAAKIKERGAFIFAIGVGRGVDVNELNGISSDPDQRFTIQVSGFNELNSDEVKQMLLKRACVEIETTPAPTPAPTTTPKQKTEDCKELLADIFFVLDQSSSIKTEANFNKTLHFVTGVIDYLQVSPSETQVGALKFSDKPEMQFHLTDYTDKQEAASAVSRIKWKGGNTYLDKALRMLRTEGLNKAYGSRDDVPQIAVIITDGVSTNPYETKKELAKLHSLNYLLFAIGVGPYRDPAELARIANDPDNVFEVESPNGLQAIRESLVTRIVPRV
ncbi:Hypothetical predicted protein [Mytilus galloprovincialis]|uniref:VWFA domain-containing protein n=2 Tax=Mytilus galloprovincialis TaxID=29158 RepID=A0A8B6CB10_MYTGA|nr:Hypothetical predicted protein [Mytilus galloprovincialis]